MCELPQRRGLSPKAGSPPNVTRAPPLRQHSIRHRVASERNVRGRNAVGAADGRSSLQRRIGAPGSKGAEHPLPDRRVQRGVGWLSHLRGVNQPSAEPPKRQSGHRPEQPRPGLRGQPPQAPRSLGRRPLRRARATADRHPAGRRQLLLHRLLLRVSIQRWTSRASSSRFFGVATRRRRDGCAESCLP